MSIASPHFSLPQEYIAHLEDVRFWRPYLAEILERHDLSSSSQRAVAGQNATFPTFLCSEVVVKLFGGPSGWHKSFAGESAALELLATDPKIPAPRLLAKGYLFEARDLSWPYLVTIRIPGLCTREARLKGSQREGLAVEIGQLIGRVQALHSRELLKHEDWGSLNMIAALEKSSLPTHLIHQVEPFLGRLEPFDSAFVHGDLNARHAFVENGRLCGIIDWGDAMLTDPHYELIQIYRDLFDCNKELFRVFLEAANWPIGEAFARRALGLAFHRQAIGLVQHHTMDVFEPIAARFPLENIATLEELARKLFSVEMA